MGKIYTSVEQLIGGTPPAGTDPDHQTGGPPSHPPGQTGIFESRRLDQRPGG